MQYVKKVFQLLTFNWKQLLIFELFYKLICYALAIPLFRAAVSGIIWISGYRYITRANFLRFLFHPLTLLLAILLFFLMTFVCMIDISTVIFLLDCSYQKKRVTLLSAVKFSIKNTRKIFRPGCVALVGFVLFMIPFVHLGVSSGMITSIAKPEYLLSQVNTKWYWMLMFYGGLLVIVFFLMRWLYLFHYFTLEDQTFHDAKGSSLRLVKPHILTDFLVLVLIEGIMYLIYQLSALIGISIITLATNAVKNTSLAPLTLYSAIILFLAVLLLLFLAFSFPLIYAVISVLYYTHKEHSGEPVRHPDVPEIPKKPVRRRMVVVSALVLAAAVGFLTFYLHGVSRGNYELLMEDLHITEVTAHRGDVKHFPENTLAAFQGAFDAGADKIELDVQELRDGTIIVCHDKNMKRLCGVDRNVWDLTWPEVQELRVQGERIPLLTEVLELAKKLEIRLIIELKPTGHEVSLVPSVVDQIRESQIAELCEISSLNYPILEEVKEYDAGIKTVYFTNIALGHLDELEAADELAIEPTFLTPPLLTYLHNKGKQVYAWTVDQKNNINRMIRLGVDNIVTNDIDLVKECVEKNLTGNKISRIVEEITALFGG